MQQRRKHQIRQLELRNSRQQKLLEEKQALERLSIFKENIFRRYGFLADLSKPTTAEARQVIGEMTVTEYQNRFSNMTCPNICQTSNPMSRVRSLLGLGFNFCLQKPTTSMNTKKNMNRLCYEMHHIDFQEPNGGEGGGEGERRRAIHQRNLHQVRLGDATSKQRSLV